MCIYYNVKQICSFIYAFRGEIYGQLRNIYLGKPLLTSKKKFFFWFIYTRLDSPTLVYIGLQSSSDSSMFLEYIWLSLSLKHIYIFQFDL